MGRPEEPARTISVATSWSEAIVDLDRRFRRELLWPADPGYGEARRFRTASSTSGPALITRCRGVADVMDAVAFAQSARPWGGRDREGRK